MTISQYLNICGVFLHIYACKRGIMTVDQNGKLFALLMVAMDASFYVSIQTVTLILNSGSTLGSVVLDSLAN